MNKRQAEKFLRKAEDRLRKYLKGLADELITEALTKTSEKTPVQYVVKYKALGFDIQMLLNTLNKPYVADTRRHKRRLPTKTVWVRRHDKTYTPGYMPVPSGNAGWYTAKIDNYDFGKPLRTAWETVMKRRKMSVKDGIELKIHKSAGYR